MLLRRRSFLIATGCTAAIVGLRLHKRWPPRTTVGLRVCSWNLRNFPDAHDRQRMAQTLRDMGPDVVLLQEVAEPHALGDLLPGYAIRASVGGGRGGQRLAIALRPARVRSIGPRIEFSEISMGGRVRPALALPIGWAGHSAWIVCVHLKATPDGLELRRQQWNMLAEITAELSGPVLLGGDFNCTGGRDSSEAEEFAEITSRLGAASLQALPLAGGCSAAWGGVRYDAWQEPSRLDMMWLRGWSTAASSTELSPGTHCRTHGCRPFRSTSAYPDLDLERASDHCPIFADLPCPIGSASASLAGSAGQNDTAERQVPGANDTPSSESPFSL